MSEPEDIDNIFILLDELNERTTDSIVKALSEELHISDEESLEYVKQWIYYSGESYEL